MVQPGVRLTDVFDRLDHAMLILGAPGSGKTITLLELLRDLLAQAQANKNLPIPVVLPLASWALSREPMSAWISREVDNNYHIEARHVREWIGDEQMVLLLDGLDEVTSEHRDACVQAINDFRNDHHNMPIVVCCRTLDYQEFGTVLTLYGTLTVLPLTRQQVEKFLERPDKAFAGAQAALVRDPRLWELADSPLMLSIMVLAFREHGLLGSLGDGTPQGLLNRLFEKYVHSMLESHRTPKHPAWSTIRRITFVARQLQRDNQTVFSTDLLDTGSLPNRWWSTVLTLVHLILWGAVMILGMGAAFMVFYGWRGALVGGLVGFLCSASSKIRIDSFDFSFKAKWNEFPEDDSPDLTLETLLEAAPTALPGAERPDWMSETRSLLTNMPEKELEALKRLHGDALELEVTKRLLAYKLPSLSQDEVTWLIELPEKRMRKEIRRGTLKKRLSEGELSWLEGAFAYDPIRQLDEEEPIFEDELKILRSSDSKWSVRLIQRWQRVAVKWIHFRWILSDKSYLFGDISIIGLFTVLAIAVIVWVLLGKSYAAAAALGGITALAAMNAISKLVSRAPRRGNAASFPSPGLRATLRAGVPIAPAVGSLAGLTAGLFLAWITVPGDGFRFGVSVAVCATLFAAGCLGGFAFIQQLRIRLVLHLADLLPIHGGAFLDYATQCLFLRCSGETYIFAHRSLQEFFAAFCPEGNDPDDQLIEMLVQSGQLMQSSDADAQYNRGILLADRLDPPDLDGARAWYTRAAKAGHTAAQFSLGVLLAEKLDPPDLDEARTWLTRAAEADNPEAQFALGLLLGDRLDPPDLNGARTWYTRAATAGYTMAQCHLGELLAWRLDPPDLNGARTWFTRAAEAGDTNAQVDLGLLLAEELDPPDLDGARVWLTRAARADDTYAQRVLAQLLTDRLDPPDLDGARKWLTRAATAGDTNAQVDLGLLLARKLDPPDRDKARAWLTRAAKKDDAKAQVILASLIEEWTDSSDLDEARMWYTRAAEAGNLDAQGFLGLLLVKLDPPDLEGARAWWTRAAEAGDPDAQCSLALLLAYQWEPPDLNGARAWLNRAARAGDVRALGILDQLGKN